jgi:hypothetical protein
MRPLMSPGPARLALDDAVEQVPEVADDRQAGRGPVDRPPGSCSTGTSATGAAIRRLVRKVNADTRFRAAFSGTLSEQHVQVTHLSPIAQDGIR